MLTNEIWRYPEKNQKGLNSLLVVSTLMKHDGRWDPLKYRKILSRTLMRWKEMSLASGGAKLWCLAILSEGLYMSNYLS